MNLRIKNGPVRIAVVALALAAWFLAFNHCAIAAFQPKAIATSQHSHCGEQQKPGKEGQGDDLPCCKTLSATAVAVAKSVVDYDSHSSDTKDYFIGHILLLENQQTAGFSEFDDTGPPGTSSFAESVLQRSLFAHAPPRLA